MQLRQHIGAFRAEMQYNHMAGTVPTLLCSGCCPLWVSAGMLPMVLLLSINDDTPHSHCLGVRASEHQTNHSSIVT